MKNLAQLIEKIGSAKVAEICNVSVRAANKWRTNNALPRTDYTGETCYAKLLSRALNGEISEAVILDLANPIHSRKANPLARGKSKSSTTKENHKKGK